MTFCAKIRTVYGIEREVVFEADSDAPAALEAEAQAHLGKGEELIEIERIDE